MTVWIARLLLVLALLGTAAHAVRDRRRGARAPITAAAVAVWTALAVGQPGLALALPTISKDHLSDFIIDDADPEASVPDVDTQNRKPLQFGYFLQDLAGKAEAAEKRGDHAAAARLFRALAKATPKSAYGPRKLCLELELAGDLPGAIVACRTALTREGTTTGDHARFVQLALARKTLAPLEEKEVEAVIAHLEKEAPGVMAAKLRCALAVRIQDRRGLESCTAVLAKTAGDDPQTVSFLWALALMKSDRTAAHNLIDRARTLGVSGDGLAKMEQATSEMSVRRLVRVAAGALAAALLMGLTVFGLRVLALRRREQIPVGAAPPTA